MLISLTFALFVGFLSDCAKSDCDGIKWVNINNFNISESQPFIGGKEGQLTLYHCRVNHEGNIVTGKAGLEFNFRACWIPANGKEIEYVDNFEILTNPTGASLQYVNTSSDQPIPFGALEAGRASNGNIIHMSRAIVANKQVLGKVDNGEAYVPYFGGAIFVRDYEILTCSSGIPSTIDATPLTNGSCLIPYDLPYSLTVYYMAKHQEIPKGSYAVPFSQIIYKCNENYTMVGSSTNFCLNGIWSIQNHPNCYTFCSPKPFNGITIKATCEINGEQIGCLQSHKPGTVVHIACALGYRKPVDRIFTNVFRCGENGEWDYPPFRCEQVCGIEAPDVVPYIIGGENVNITKVPWHVGIYSNIINKSNFTQICGGTILNAKIVLSAAHCFWDSSENQFFKPSNFKVAAGKYYRDFYRVEPIKPQMMDIESIIFKQEYNDYAGYYALDIILLVLNDHIQFNAFIKPICLEYNLNFNEQQVQPGLIGKVAGWGLEASDSRTGSLNLKIIDLPAIEYNECKRKLSAELLPFITGDKFCAGYTNGHSVCRGDSGGGLVFPKQIGSNTVYFLRGIVSTGGNKAGSCDNDKYTLFTNVHYHIKLISFYESLNRPQ